MLNKKHLILFCISFCFFVCFPEAWAQHKGISFQTVIKRPDGTFINVGGITVTAQILDPLTNCVLREEEHSSKNITNGYLNIVLGDSGASTPVARNPSPILSLSQVMDNKTSRTGLKCVDQSNNIVATNQSYTPSNLDRRILRLRMNIQGETVSADFNMRAVGFAVNSEMLNSKSDADFVNVNSVKGVTQSNLESIFERFTQLDAILGNFNNAGDAAGINITGNAATATNVTGTVAIANGGTGASSAAGARTNLGLGSLSTLTTSGTPDGSKFLRDDGVWSPVAGGVSSVAGRTGVVTLSHSDISGLVASATTDTTNAMNITTGTLAYGRLPVGMTASTVAAGDDVRFSDARTPSGAAAGDLSGNYPNPTVIKIQGRAVDGTLPLDGQVMLWDNGTTTWKAQYVRMQDVRNAWGGTQMIPSSTCGSNEAMAWSLITDRFICQPIGSLNASAITSGTLSASVIPNLDWAKIATGKPTTLSAYGITDSVANGGSTPSIQTGLLGARPGFGVVGRLYIASDTNALYRDTGSAWVLIGDGTGAGGGVTNVSSANSDIVVVNGATTPELTLNSTAISAGASDSGKIVKLNASGLMDTTIIPNVDTAKITSGVLPIVRGGTNSFTTLNNNRVMISSAGAIVENAAITASRAVASDVNGLPVASAVTSTELGYLSGMTSNVQTQLTGKVSSTGWSNYGIIATDGSGTMTAVTGSLTGSILQYSATGPVYSSAAYPTATSANQLLYSSASNVVAGLSTANNAILTTNGSGVPSWSVISNDSFAQYALLAGRSGGQTLNGGTAASNNLILDSTTNATKGFVLLSPTGGNVGIGTATPQASLDVKGTLRLSGSTSGYVGLVSPATAGSSVYTLPTADGTSGQVLTTNGSGVLSWSSVAAGGGSSYYQGKSETAPITWIATSWTGIHNILTLSDTQSSGISRSDSTFTFTKSGLYYLSFASNGWGSGSRYLGFRLRKTNGTAETKLQITNYINAMQPGTPLMGIFSAVAGDTMNLEYVIKGGTSGAWAGSNPMDSENLVSANITMFSFDDGGASSADNLGNHTATQNIVLGSNYLSGNGSNNGIRIDSSGNVGIGIANPGYKLDVQGGGVNASGGYTQTSDIRLKTNIEYLNSKEALDKITTLHGIYYDWKDQAQFGKDHQMGLIAQDVQRVFPEAVKTNSEGFLSVSYSNLVAPAIEAIKELLKVSNGHSREIASLKDRAEKAEADAAKQKQENATKTKELEAIKSYLCAKDPYAAICK